MDVIQPGRADLPQGDVLVSKCQIAAIRTKLRITVTAGIVNRVHSWTEGECLHIKNMQITEAIVARDSMKDE